VDLIVSPTTVAFNTQSGAPTPTFQTGEVLNAVVQQLLDNGNVRLAIANAFLEVQTQIPLTVGMTVRLAVKSTDQGIQLVVLGPAANAAGSRTVADAAGANGASVGTASEMAEDVAEASDLAAPSPANDPANPSVALAQAVRSAASQQSGLAPLFADLAVAANSSTLPQPVHDAIAQLLAFRPTLDGDFSADDVQQAFLQSGLFLEARLASTIPGASNAAQSSPTSSSAPTASPASNASNAAAETLGAQMLSQPPGDDLKAALTVLRQVLKAWVDVAPTTASPLPAGAPASSLARDLLLALPGTPAQEGEPQTPNTSSALLLAQSMAAARPQLSSGAASAPPPPPYRGAPTTSQPAAAPTLSPASSPHDIAARLLSETDGALSRQTLLQAASLPAGANPQSAAARPDPSGPRWNFEVPFATPQGTSIAQFEISRDGRGTPAEGQKAVWRARFSIDIEPMGPVHAQVALIGARATVTLWAERPDSAMRLRQSAPMLSDALREAELEPGDVFVRDGAQPRQAAPAGRFLDRAS
jgi:hypothetical protein